MGLKLGKLVHDGIAVPRTETQMDILIRDLKAQIETNAAASEAESEVSKEGDPLDKIEDRFYLAESKRRRR